MAVSSLSRRQRVKALLGASAVAVASWVYFTSVWRGVVLSGAGDAEAVSVASVANAPVNRPAPFDGGGGLVGVRSLCCNETVGAKRGVKGHSGISTHSSSKTLLNFLVKVCMPPGAVTTM